VLQLVVFAERKLRDLLSDRRGVTAMEYGIIAATTVVVVGAAIGGIGGNLGSIWGKISTTMASAV
jgi:pilus assembly protein Flp/PilA